MLINETLRYVVDILHIRKRDDMVIREVGKQCNLLMSRLRECVFGANRDDVRKESA